MRYVYFGLFGEGSTDRYALPPIIDSTIGHLQKTDGLRVHFEWQVHYAGKSSNSVVSGAVAGRSYEIVLAHRDGSGDPPTVRSSVAALNAVGVVPVRETEAWLIVDAIAVAAALGVDIQAVEARLPATSAVESEPDPKAVLQSIVREHAGMLRGGEYEQVLELIATRTRVTELNRLPSYRQFVADLRDALVSLGWPFRT